jgi:hypothetical protein
MYTICVILYLEGVKGKGPQETPIEVVNHMGSYYTLSHTSPSSNISGEFGGFLKKPP